MTAFKPEQAKRETQNPTGCRYGTWRPAAISVVPSRLKRGIKDSCCLVINGVCVCVCVCQLTDSNHQRGPANMQRVNSKLSELPGGNLEYFLSPPSAPMMNRLRVN